MKKDVYSLIRLVAFCGLALLTVGSLQAQDVIHPTGGTANNTIPAGTTVTYSDSGGSGGNYSLSESGTSIFCPDTPGEVLTITFQEVDIEVSTSGSGSFASVCCWDGLTITDANFVLFQGCGEDSGDGDDACGTEGGLNDLNPGDSFTSTAANGCLNVAFSSDSSLTEPGWEATVSSSGEGGGDCEDNEVVVDMFDSFGDGWNGNTLDIFDEEGSMVATATVLSTDNGGDSNSETFCLPDGCYTVDVGGGSFLNEISWDISVNGGLTLSGGGASETDLSLAVNTECEEGPVEGELPFPWIGSGVGAECNNDFGFDSGTFAITACGRNGYSNAADNIAYASQTLCGNGSITVRVEDVTGSGFGGVALRESTAPGAKQVMLLSNETSLLPWVTRTATNAPNNFTPFWRAHTYWLKLERIGNYIRGFASTTGNSFSLVAQVYIPMDVCIEMGMVTVNTGGGQTTATFSNVTVVGGGQALAADETSEAGVSDRDKTTELDIQGFEQPATVEAARLFPNPTSDRITIALPAVQPAEAVLTLRNQLGQVLKSRQVEAGLFQADWDVSQLSGGVYYMEVRYEGQQPQVLRFVKTQ
jgi:hypothetical protein